jgi:hypothetical protein
LGDLVKVMTKPRPEIGERRGQLVERLGEALAERLF